MAFSQPLTSSIRKGQMALVCELCENDPKLKWKCLDCRLMMCQRCRDKVHSKFHQDHTIIDIKDISKYQEEPKADFTKLKCGEHAGQNCCLFCKPCDQLVCPLCIAKTHQQHSLIEIREGFKMKMQKIKSDQKNINAKIKILSKGQEELQKVKFLEKSSYQKSKQGIQDYKESVKKAFENHMNHCDKLEHDLDQQWSAVVKSVTDEENRAQGMKKTLLKQNEELQDLCQSTDTVTIFSSKSPAESMKLNTQVKTLFDHVPKFVPGDVSKLSVLQGSLEKVPLPYNTDLNVVQQFQTKYITIDSLEVCSDNALWVNDYNSKLIQKVITKQNSLEVKSSFNIKVSGMSITPSGDVLLCVFGSSVLKIIPSGTEELKDSTYDVSPLLTLGVHVSKGNKVILGARDEGSAIPATGPRQVIIFDKSGLQEKVFQYNNNNKPLFTFPIRITSTSGNNIGVVDVLSGSSDGRIVVLDQKGDVINIYTGHPDVNSDDNLFIPFDIVSTPSDNMVVADVRNHTLHILSSEGNIIAYYNTEDIGIELQCSLSFNHTGQLYIGCDTYKGSNELAKIYKINNFIY